MSAPIAGQRIAIIGAGGFLGANITRHLIAEGAEVVAFGRSRRFHAPFAGADWREGEIEEAGALSAAIAGAGTVIHLAGGATPARAEADPVADVGAAIANSVRVLEACRSAAVGRVIFVSSGGAVYGPPAAAPFSEEDATAPISFYGQSKLAVEGYVRLFNRRSGMRNLSLRIANPFGPYQSPDSAQGAIPIFLRKALTGAPIEIWGDGSAVRDYVYVGDVAAAIAAAVAYEGDLDVFNVGSGVGRSLRDVVAAVEGAVGRPVEIRWRPARAFDAPASILDVSRIEGALGWAPRTGFREQLARTRDWVEASLGGE